MKSDIKFLNEEREKLWQRLVNAENVIEILTDKIQQSDVELKELRDLVQKKY